MGRRQFPKVVIFLVILVLSISQGFGRKMTECEQGTAKMKKIGGESRQIIEIEVMDYSEPGPNVNPRTGYMFSPSPPPHPQG